MKNTIKITIPKPCHENWLEMTPAEQGKFCQLCQKNVFDFTQSSDREISKALENDQFLCGRFSNSQLNRDLVVPKEKSSIWLATTSAIISFLGLGTQETVAQGNVVKVEQTDKKVVNNETIVSEKEIEITGVVSDNFGPLPGANVVIKGTNKGVQSDIKGNFSIKADENDILVFSFIGMETKEIAVQKKNSKLQLEMNAALNSTTVGVIIVKKRTFFGSIFHSIGNWFK
jgi:rRNA processing protein Gar1